MVVALHTILSVLPTHNILSFLTSSTVIDSGLVILYHCVYQQSSLPSPVTAQDHLASIDLSELVNA